MKRREKAERNIKYTYNELYTRQTIYYFTKTTSHHINKIILY